MELNDLLLNLIDLCLNVQSEISMLLFQLRVLLFQSAFNRGDDRCVFNPNGFLIDTEHHLNFLAESLPRRVSSLEEYRVVSIQ